MVRFEDEALRRGRATRCRPECRESIEPLGLRVSPHAAPIEGATGRSYPWRDRSIARSRCVALGPERFCGMTRPRPAGSPVCHAGRHSTRRGALLPWGIPPMAGCRPRQTRDTLVRGFSAGDPRGWVPRWSRGETQACLNSRHPCSYNAYRSCPLWRFFLLAARRPTRRLLRRPSLPSRTEMSHAKSPRGRSARQ